ncbi:uncharacterized protein LOC124439908 isoform X2 [Xenia sp. Carnegie-2017]|nr:uncharacterized protein LOC124439908 isoform X2 [Xenia sp. Carnegie-2017]
MVFKSLLLLVLAAYCQEAAGVRVEVDVCLKIYTARYGNVSHYGVYGNLDFLEFSKNKPAAVFKVLPKSMLQEISTKKCVHRISNGNKQLVLTYDCSEATMFPVDMWKYNSVKKWLQDLTSSGEVCLSPWTNSRAPYDIQTLTGLSPCALWNQMNMIGVPCPAASSDELEKQKY